MGTPFDFGKVESLEELWGKFSWPEYEYVGPRENIIMAGVDVLLADLNSFEAAGSSSPHVWEPFLAATANFPRAATPFRWMNKLRKRSRGTWHTDEDAADSCSKFTKYVKQRLLESNRQGVTYINTVLR